jgi:hypothetical protein
VVLEYLQNRFYPLWLDYHLLPTKLDWLDYVSVKRADAKASLQLLKQRQNSLM